MDAWRAGWGGPEYIRSEPGAARGAAGMDARGPGRCSTSNRAGAEHVRQQSSTARGAASMDEESGAGGSARNNRKASGTAVWAAPVESSGYTAFAFQYHAYATDAEAGCFPAAGSGLFSRRTD